MSYDYDLAVIGAGPGGYTGAIRAAQLGLKTVVVEKYKNLGGTCLNVGCIPSKALLDSSEHYYFLSAGKAKEHGVVSKSVSLDLSAMMMRKQKIVKELTGGIAYLLKKNKIERLEGEAAFLTPHELKIQADDGEKSMSAKHILLATGSKPRNIPGLDFDDHYVISSTGALSLDRVPKHLLIVGGGYIGLEMASVWSRLGAKVTVLEFSPELCPTLDRELRQSLFKVLKAQGIRFLMEVSASHVEKVKKKVVLTYKDKNQKPDRIEGDIVLVAVGRVPYTSGLDLEKQGILMDDKGFVQVDDCFRTSPHSHIYAIGDVIGGAMLAHKAEEEGVCVAEHIAGIKGHVNYETLPSVIYTWPEVASVGLTEEQLQTQGVSFNKGKFPFTANGRAKALGETSGFGKVLADKKTDKILGVHIIGPRASDMIIEAGVAMEFGGSSEDLAKSFHAHPTLSEVMREASLAVRGLARQM